MSKQKEALASDKKPLMLKCFKCNNECEGMTWANVHRGKIYTTYFCKVCKVEYGRVGDSPHWHYVESLS